MNIQNQKIDFRSNMVDETENAVQIMNYNHIPMNGYNLTSDLEYLKHHNQTIVSIMIKQNKKSELDGFDYDFSRFIDISGDHELMNRLVNSSADDFNTFLIQYFQ